MQPSNCVSTSFFSNKFLEQIGAATGVSLGAILFLGFGAFSRLFTEESEVLEIAWSGILVRQ